MRIFAEGFLVTIIFGTGLSLAHISLEINNDADLIFTAVWQQTIGFSDMANLFDCDGGPYSYLGFKKWSLSNFE